METIIFATKNKGKIKGKSTKILADMECKWSFPLEGKQAITI